ncbi:hypothetical protein NHX12_034011 [Muraenolepis orangiensis]|uniref:Cystatin fetuin-B-type domain-containing protein n=1 Tax=Muraenolepis orangiensis TaxID=630683 RepID=A0A9Q0E4U3_9TELE|nr:hypothetical protein NHX12_034011 [Muraenolepis orangiensis]
MKFLYLLSLVCVALAAPVDETVEEKEGMKTGSCADAFSLSAAALVVGEINKDRQEGYIMALHRLANVNEMSHGETGVVFYLTVDVVETDCHVLSKKNWRSCTPRGMDNGPMYGQCKATIYINKPQRVVRLYKYRCMVRPVSSESVVATCPDCPTQISLTSDNVLKATSLSLDKFNKESGLSHRFNLGNITRAVSQGGIMEFYSVEYTIQESTCTKDQTATDKCPLMDCEFAHKGFCKGSFSVSPTGEEDVQVDCTLYEPESAEAQKRLHLLGGEMDHSHTDKATAAHDHTHSHDHAEDHTKDGHAHGDGHTHGDGHAHGDGHVHGAAHDHVHAHHAKAHEHAGDGPNQHHQYAHADVAHTHDHDHDLALDHDHKHSHLHEHEHHHHHHEPAAAKPHRHPEGTVVLLPPMGQPTTLPVFPEEGRVTLNLVQDPAIPGLREPTIQPFPSAVAADCPAALSPDAPTTLVTEAFAADPLFKVTA